MFYSKMEKGILVMDSYIVNFEEFRERFDRQYENAVYLPDNGIPGAEVDKSIRDIYDQGIKADTPFIIVRAQMLAFALGHIRLTVADFDSFASVCEKSHEIIRIQNERYDSIAQQRIGEKLEKSKWAESSGLFRVRLDLSHTSPSWDDLLNLGVPGLLERAEELCRKQPSPFAESVKIVCQAFRSFILRFAKAAEDVKRDDLAEMLEFIANHPPRTFQQALELGILFREAQEMEGEPVRSMGIFDRQYYPFFKSDLAEERLTGTVAEELLLIYFSRFHAQSRGREWGVPFCFGGSLPNDGGDGCNELTMIAWRAFRRLGLVDPKFSLRVNSQTPEDILRFAAECIKEGKSSMVFANETVAHRMFLRNGKDPKDLKDFIPIGCYEPAIMGKELSCTMTVLFNFAKIIDLIMADWEFTPRNFEELITCYLSRLKAFLADAMQLANCWEKLWPQINPSPLLSGTMEECMVRGRDVSLAGTKYASSGVMCAGIGTAVDALAAIHWLVFEQKRVTFSRLREILKEDWLCAENLRIEVSARAPKWGCGNSFTDDIGKRVSSAAAKEIEGTPNAKGGLFQMGLWSIDWIRTFGDLTNATPDGRRRGELLSKNAGSSIGCDREGIAGLINSVGKLDHTHFANGSVLDVMLPPRTVAEPEGTDFLCNIIKTFFKKGGFFIHFNILSAQEMKKAQIHPERFANLQIRLCGWNVRFVDLDKPMQDCLICEAEAGGKDL